MYKATMCAQCVGAILCVPCSCVLQSPEVLNRYSSVLTLIESHTDPTGLLDKQGTRTPAPGSTPWRGKLGKHLLILYSDTKRAVN